MRIKGTRKFHRFHGVAENIIRCYITSKTDIYEDHNVNKFVFLTLETNDTVACIYDGQCWLAQVEQINLENSDVHVHFYHPAGPKTSFKKSASDRVWIPIKRVLRKLSALELSTAIGRCYCISDKLSEEISMLLKSHSE